MTRPLPLVLSAKRRTWRMNDDGAADSGQEFRKVERAIVERDDFTCQFCSFRDPLGFRAPRYLGVHHHDDDHANNAPGNLITACHPCHMVHHLGFAGMSGDYALAWLPELPQVKLFHLVRSITVATHFAAALEQGQVAQTVRATVRAMEEAAQNLMAALHSRQTAAKKIYGTADPAEMANALLLLDDDAYAARRRTIGALRLLDRKSVV